ncbi:MAG: site-specific DNA-methyltransferase [Proteobacteria bacterium]|nr:site-specific DNA-methyltransferase [Pseudomonadota bacterium]
MPVNSVPLSAVPCSQILHGDNLTFLQQMESESVQLIYIDPPFNTGRVQSRRRLKTVRTDTTEGDRTGYAGKRYRSEVLGEIGYNDSFDDYLGFLAPRLQQAHRLLAANGSLFFHIDWRESARCRLLLEEIFGGSEHCINEIIWAYDYGARSTKKWSTKHDNIYWFAKNPNDYIYNYDAIDRIPYMAPSLVGREKAKRGKTPTDTWWNTIVGTNSKEKTGYPTQKPLTIIERIIRVHSHQEGTVLDFFAGSGTTGVAAEKLGRRYILIDESKQAYAVAQKRLNADIPSATSATP